MAAATSNSSGGVGARQLGNDGRQVPEASNGRDGSDNGVAPRRLSNYATVTVTEASDFSGGSGKRRQGGYQAAWQRQCRLRSVV